MSTVRLEDFVPASHPLRPIRKWINEALAKMDEKFSAIYEADIKGGRPSVAPEKLMRAMLLLVLYSLRSERQLVEQISYNLLFPWFVSLSIEDAVWNHSVFSKNRDRLIEHEADTELFNSTVEMAREKGLLSGEHFSVDGTIGPATRACVARTAPTTADRPRTGMVTSASSTRTSPRPIRSRGCTARAG